jgi:hypothetical protein
MTAARQIAGWENCTKVLGQRGRLRKAICGATSGPMSQRRHMHDIFQHAWRLWKRVGQVIGNSVARFVMTVFYFTIFVPFALRVRLLSDPLGIKARDNPCWWLDRETRDRTLEDARRQF